MLGTGKALMMISWLRTQNTDYSTISLLPDRLACTFLGPSRKRGPPKGYIDAIESRLHQTEAVIGILLALAHPEAGEGTYTSLFFLLFHIPSTSHRQSRHLIN